MAGHSASLSAFTTSYLTLSFIKNSENLHYTLALWTRSKEVLVSLVSSNFLNRNKGRRDGAGHRGEGQGEEEGRKLQSQCKINKKHLQNVYIVSSFTHVSKGAILPCTQCIADTAGESHVQVVCRVLPILIFLICNVIVNKICIIINSKGN